MKKEVVESRVSLCENYTKLFENHYCEENSHSSFENFIVIMPHVFTVIDIEKESDTEIKKLEDYFIQNEKKFIEIVKDIKSTMMMQQEFINYMDNFLKYFYKELATKKNIFEKNYYAKDYFILKLYEANLNSDKKKRVIKIQNKVESFIFDELIGFVMKYIEIGEINDFNRKCLSICHNMFNDDKKSYKEEITSLLTEFSNIYNEIRNSYYEFDGLTDLTVKYKFQMYRMELEKKIIKTSSRAIELRLKAPSIVESERLLNVISKKKKCCEPCSKYEDKIIEFIDEYSMLYKEKRYKELRKRAKKFIKSTKTFHKHIKKEHEYFNLDNLKAIRILVGTILIIFGLTFPAFLSIKFNTIFFDSKAGMALVVFPLFFIYGFIFNRLEKKVMKKKLTY